MISYEQFQRNISYYKRICKRAEFIMYISKGYSISKAAEKTGISRQYGYKIIRSIVSKDNGYYMQKCKLTRSQMEIFIRHLIRMKVFKLKHAEEYIEKKFGIKYCTRELRKLLKENNFKYYKILKGYADIEYYNSFINKVKNRLDG